MTEDKTVSTHRRAEPDFVTLIAGLFALAMSTSIIFGAVWNLHWILAGTAVGIGTIILVVARRRRRD